MVTVTATHSQRELQNEDGSNAIPLVQNTAYKLIPGSQNMTEAAINPSATMERYDYPQFRENFRQLEDTTSVTSGYEN